MLEIFEEEEASETMLEIFEEELPRTQINAVDLGADLDDGAECLPPLTN